MRRSRIVIAAAVAFATLVAGAGIAYAAIGKTVTLAVDGERHRIHTFASTVGGALDHGGVQYRERDLVVPAADNGLDGGSVITVRHARQLALTVDGVHHAVWVVANSVGEALNQLGLGGLGAVVSASRSRRIPLSGLDLRVRLPHRVTVLADGKARTVVTTAPTVSAMLARLHIRLAATDRVSLPLREYPADGIRLRVTRVRTKTVTDTIAIPYQTMRHPDSSISKGERQTDVAGVMGAMRRTFRATYVDGKLRTKRLVARRQTAAPHNAVVRYGTKEAPQSSGGGSYSGGFGGLNWSALADCESGGNPRAVSSGGSYRGLYQFSISTWNSVGGSGDPIDASPSEQTYRAWVLYQRSGRGPWPVCGQYL